MDLALTRIKLVNCAKLIFCGVIFSGVGSTQSTNQSAVQPVGIQISPTEAVKNTPWKQRKDYALLFATNEYDSWPSLINPIPDAEAIAEELKTNYGFEVEVVRNPSRERIVSKLREYSKKPLGEFGQLFIFFAGHGLYDDVFKQGFIVSRDSKLEDETRASYESYDDLRTIVNSMQTKHILLVLDACYSGTFDRRIGDAGTRGSESYANFTLPELFANKVRLSTRKYLTSGGKDYVPDGAPNHHSPFAAHFLEALRTYGGMQGYITFSGVLSIVEQTRPQPYWGEWGDNEPGSEFLFISKRLTEELSKGTPSNLASASAGGGDRGVGGALESLGVRPSIAVVGFQNVTGSTQDSWVSTALSEWLTTEMAAGGKIRTVSGEDVARAKADLTIRDVSGYAKDTLQRLHKVLDSQYVVSGSYARLGEAAAAKFRVDFRLQNVDTGEVIGDVADTATQVELADVVAKAAESLSKKLGIGLAANIAAETAKAAEPANTEALRLYAEGLTRLRSYDLLAARDLLQSALKADPKFALAHSALSKAWTDLGYDGRAREEAAAAMDLATKLPLESRLMIEARFRQSNSEWARAAEIYRSLWTFYPDDSEYGLQLAGVEIASGQATDALATLTKLRKNSGQAMQNPQVDIEEAIAEENLSEAKKQLLAARKAVEEAGAAGSKFLLALGYWQECQASFVLGDLSGAEAACDEANRAADSAAGKREKARSLTLLATIREAQGHTSEAMELREEALAFARQTGSQKDIIGALFNLSVMKAGMGQLDEASQGYEEARKVAQEIGDERQLAIINIGDAAVLFTKGDFIAARNEFSEVFRAASKLGDMSDAILALQNSALVSLEVGDVAKALADAKEAKALATKSSLPDVEAVCSNTLGDILRAQADSAGAGKEYDFALAAFTRLGDQGNIAATHVSIINLLLEEGTTKGLAEMAQQAVEEFQREKATDLEASARAAWAMSLAADKRVDEALSQIKAAEQLPVLDLTIRLSLSLSKAHVLAAGQQWKDAEQVLEAGLRQAKKHKASRYELEIRLASLEIMALESKSKGEAVFHKQSLTDLEHDARESGYLAVALRAAKDSGQ